MEIATWWQEQMRSLLPTALSAAARAPDARIVAIDRLGTLESGRPEGAILLRRQGQETQLAALDLDHAPGATQPGLATCLRLPPGNVLSREVVLPLAAARNAEAVIGFEMDRLTPFAAAELFWAIGGIRHDRTHGKVSLRLSFVLRAEIEHLLQALRRIGLAPAFIEAGGGQIDLAARHQKSAGWRQSALAALCGCLALACAASPFLRQQAALNAAARNIAAITPAAQTAQNLRRQLEISASSQAAIAQARRSGDALQVLASLTEALPDGTWLNDLLLKSGDLTFDGRSADAAALIGRLSAVPGLQNPSFTAPVTRTADGAADEFSLHATVRE